MNFLADESVDGPIVYRLRERGYRVQYVAELDPGIDDEVVLAMSRDLEAILITADKDFGELVFRRQLTHTGVILIRLPEFTPQQRAELTANVIHAHEYNLKPPFFAVLSPRSFRLRRK